MKMVSLCDAIYVGVAPRFTRRVERTDGGRGCGGMSPSVLSVSVFARSILPFFRAGREREKGKKK